MRLRIRVTAAACAGVFLLGCEARTTTPSAVFDQQPQLDRVDNGGCPPGYRFFASWGVGVDPDRNEDGAVCLYGGVKREHEPPPIDMTIDSPTTLALRAERGPRLDGRVYTIGVQVTDAFHNISSTTATCDGAGEQANRCRMGARARLFDRS